MEAQPPPPQSQPTPPAPQLNYPDSVGSSPRSYDDPFPPATTTTKLRLMCSYGGHIVPRPHDKSLCYVGGDTRMVVVDRQTSLSDLSAGLSKSFLNGLPFVLKYQLPSEDLDSLVSVSTDEDLENMIEEHDHRTVNLSSLSKPSRIRLFLFPVQTDSAQAQSQAQVQTQQSKSDDWFMNALNGTRSGSLDGGLSDSASVNCLLGLDGDVVASSSNSDVNGKNVKQGQDVQSVPDSPMLGTNSSFGSTSSSPPSLANLPPIRVHVNDVRVGSKVPDQKVTTIEEQFAQLGVDSVGQKQDEGFVALSSPPPVISTAITAVASEYPNQVVSDDDARSDHGVPVGYTNHPLISQPQAQALPAQFQPKSAGAVDLGSPHSVSSDSYLSNETSRPQTVMYVDPKLNASDPHGQIQMQQHVQDPGYVLQPQFDQQQPQQQFIHGTHLIHHTPSGPVSIPAYYPVQLHPQQYQVYYVPAKQAQAYIYGEPATTHPSSQPQSLLNPASMVLPSSAAYNPSRNAPMPKFEMSAAGVYGTAAATPQFVQVPNSNHQQQYIAYSQIHHSSESTAPNSAVPANYAYDYADSAYRQVFYPQHLVPPMPSQYQTMTPSAMGLPEVSAQLPSDNMKQQVRTTQPL